MVVHCIPRKGLLAMGTVVGLGALSYNRSFSHMHDLLGDGEL